MTLGLSRNGNHVYTYDDGVQVVSPIPSVTTVLGVIDKSGPLVGWAKRETAACAVRNLPMLATMVASGGDQAAIDWLKGIPDYQRDTAADLGTSIHVVAEKIARGQPVEVMLEIAPSVESYRAWLAEFNPAFIAVEQMVCSLTHNYAGTFDAIGVIDGEMWMLDVKSGKGIYAETALQLVAYAGAEFIGRPNEATRYRIPKVDRYGVIHVRPEGTRLIPYAVDASTFEAFLDVRRVYDWIKGPAKSIVGKPIVKEKEQVA